MPRCDPGTCRNQQQRRQEQDRILQPDILLHHRDLEYHHGNGGEQRDQLVHAERGIPEMSGLQRGVKRNCQRIRAKANCGPQKHKRSPRQPWPLPRRPVVGHDRRSHPHGWNQSERYNSSGQRKRHDQHANLNRRQWNQARQQQRWPDKKQHDERIQGQAIRPRYPQSQSTNQGFRRSQRQQRAETKQTRDLRQHVVRIGRDIDEFIETDGDGQKHEQHNQHQRSSVFPDLAQPHDKDCRDSHQDRHGGQTGHQIPRLHITHAALTKQNRRITDAKHQLQTVHEQTGTDQIEGIVRIQHAHKPRDLTLRHHRSPSSMQIRSCSRRLTSAFMRRRRREFVQQSRKNFPAACLQVAQDCPGPLDAV